MLPRRGRSLFVTLALALSACAADAARGGRASGAGSGGRGGSAGSTGGGKAALGGGGQQAGGASGSPVPPIAGRRLLWQDEFDGPKDSPADPSRWSYDIGTGENGWGNNELQYYTNRPENSHLDGQGHLVIEAFREPHSGSDFTSSRLHSSGKFEQRYGRFEARVKLPEGGKGVWPAFWMLGSDIDSVGWPDCGELDVMEHRGSEPSVNHGSAHGPGFSGGEAWTSFFRLPAPAVLPTDFHSFAIEWTETDVRWFVDDDLYNTMTPPNLTARGGEWVFDAPMYLLINLAVGGNFDGDPEAATPFPQRMLVDHIRVYE